MCAFPGCDESFRVGHPVAFTERHCERHRTFEQRDEAWRQACPKCGAAVTLAGPYHVEYACGSLKTFQGWYGPCGDAPRPEQYGEPVSA